MAKKRPARRDFEKLEQRRIKGAKLLRQGLPQAEVARRLAVSRESVRRWWNQMQAQGSPEALKKAPRAGRKPKLGSAELKELKRILKAGPAKSGFASGPWTLVRIAKVVRKEFGVLYHARHIGWILRNKLK